MDLDDVEWYVESALSRLNQTKKLPKPMLHYVPPQLFLPQYNHTDHEKVDFELARAYRRRFGLSKYEVDLAKGFFSGDVPVACMADLASPRVSDRWFRPKSVTSFLHYEYDNNHRGTYPLDTNKEGVLSRIAGLYSMGEKDVPEKLKLQVAQDEKDDRRLMGTFDRDYIQLKAIMERRLDEKDEIPSNKVNDHDLQNLKRGLEKALLCS